MLIITGTVAYDYIMDFPGRFGDHILPHQIHNINLSFIVDKFAKRRGGTGGNVSYTLGLLKSPHKLFSIAGKDFEEYKKEFEKLKISCSEVHIDHKDYTSVGFAMTDKNDNQIWGYFYGATENVYKLKVGSVVKKKLPAGRQEDLVLIGPMGARGSMSFVNQCIKLGISYMFDPGFILTQVSDADLKKGVIHADYIIGNDYEINLIKSRVLDWKKFWPSKIVITTLGAKGSTILQGNKLLKIGSAKPKKVIDPTGAGDAWRGGFLAGINRKFDSQTCGQMGSVAASFAVENYGTQEHKFSLSEFKNRYRQTYGSLLKL